MNLAPDVTVTEADGGLVLLDERRGRFYQLNPAGATALRLLLDGRPDEEVAAALGDPARALPDVRALTDALLRSGLVTGGAR